MKQDKPDISYIETLFPNKELYLIFFENASDAIIFTEDLKITDFNKAARVLFDFTPIDKILGKVLFDFSPEFQPDGILSKKKVQELITAATAVTKAKFEWQFLRSDGKTIDAEITFNSITYNNRTLQEFTIHDNTAIRNRERILLKTENKYQKFFENVQDVFYQIDLNGLITEISPSIERYSKYINKDIIGQSIDDFYFNPSDRKLLIEEIVKNGEAHDFEVLLKGKNNQLVWGSVNAHFTHDNSGQIVGIEGTIRDLSDRKLADEKLKLSLSLLQATLDSTADGILVVDRFGKITSYNKQFRQIFNLSEEILESGEDTAAIKSVLIQLKDSDQFANKIQYLYNHPELESFDLIELNDGRILERFSCPQKLDGKPIGRVWNFRDVTSRKRVEQQLHLMAHTLKSINESISITDTSNRILFVNAAFLKTYGYENENELIGQDISVVRSSGNDPEVINSILETTADLGWQGEIMNRRKDGTDFPISLSTSVVQDDKGKILGMVGVAVDITERKMAEKALLESENRYRLLIENQGEGIAIVDPTEKFIFTNPAAEFIFGVQSGELLNRNLDEFIVPEHFTKISKESEKRINNLKSTYEVDISTPDGVRKNLLITATPQTNDDGKFIGTFGVFRDITDRKQSEERLRESETKYRTLIESMPDGIYRSTPEGKFVEVNPAMIKLLGYNSKEELMAIDIKTALYFEPSDRESLVLELNPEELDVYPLKKKDGTAVWVEDHGWYIKDESGKILFHEGVSRDVTDRKIAEMQLQKYSEELQELNATKDKFFSIIAHDLKSPFNSIMGLSEIIKNEAKHLDIATIEQFGGIINSTSTNTYRLLENLLDWARLQQSRMPFSPKPILLNKLVNETIELMIEKANSKMIAIINYISNNLIIIADEEMLKTVLRNLISNALKFTSANGKIEIKAVLHGNDIEISVQDTGTGIEHADIAKIFRIDSNFTKRGTQNEKGTGLGLMLCKEFIEKHGGKIHVESEIGKGSTFAFTLKQNSSPNNI